MSDKQLDDFAADVMLAGGCIADSHPRLCQVLEAIAKRMSAESELRQDVVRYWPSDLANVDFTEGRWRRYDRRCLRPSDHFALAYVNEFDRLVAERNKQDA